MTEAPKEVTIDCSTNIITERLLTEEEIAGLELARIKHEEEIALRNIENERVAALKDSARAKLVAGEPLTEEEAATIVL
jgi:hypothetical protein